MIQLYRFIFVVGILVTQFTLFPRFNFGVWEPDLLLIITITLGMFYGIEAGCISGLILGILSDASLGVLLGAKALAWVQSGFIAGIVGDKVFIDRTSMQIMIIAFCAMIAGTFQAIFYNISTFQQSLGTLLTTTLIQTIINALVAIPMIAILRKIHWIPDTKNA